MDTRSDSHRTGRSDHPRRRAGGRARRRRKKATWRFDRATTSKLALIGTVAGLVIIGTVTTAVGAASAPPPASDSAETTANDLAAGLFGDPSALGPQDAPWVAAAEERARQEIVMRAGGSLGLRTRAARDRAGLGLPIGPNPPAGSNRALGKEMNAARGWDQHWPCLDALWTRESHWNERASNPFSGAFGIPQALPGSKMASAGADWRTNPRTQITWGLRYIAGRYGTPCAAWRHFQARNWY